MRISDWSSDVCSSDLAKAGNRHVVGAELPGDDRSAGAVIGDARGGVEFEQFDQRGVPGDRRGNLDEALLDVERARQRLRIADDEWPDPAGEPRGAATDAGVIDDLRGVGRRRLTRRFRAVFDT